MLLANDLTKIFALQVGKSYLKARESSTLEFKQSFNIAGLTEYIKDLAAFANNRGGYIVLGVKNSPHIPIGLQNEKFTKTDEERITEAINQHFAPAIDWERDTHSWNGLDFGVIYAHESINKPIIAIKAGGRNQEIRNGEIYYRYSGRTEKIHYAELKQIIDEKVQDERNAWYRLFERIAKIGPENAAILDTLAGTIESGDRTILIDDELVPKLKFIREGDFHEKKGAITLRLIGDVHRVNVVGVSEKVVHDDPYKLRPKEVAEQVTKAINNAFRASPEHVKCWKYYGVRGTYEEGKSKCNPKYCDYKEALTYFMYTQEWVTFLIKELSDPANYKKIISTEI